MSYCLLDKTGYVGDLGTGRGLDQLRTAADGKPTLELFFDSGELADGDVSSVLAEMKGESVFDGLRGLIEKGEPPFIISDGVIEDEEATEDISENAGDTGRGRLLFANLDTVVPDAGQPESSASLRAGVEAYGRALRTALAPVRKRVQRIESIDDPAELAREVAKFQKDLPRFAATLPKDGALVSAMQKAMLRAALRGLTQLAQKLNQEPDLQATR